MARISDYEAMAHDPRTYYSMPHGKPMCEAIAKHNLAREVGRAGSLGQFSDLLQRRGEYVSKQTISRWIHGEQHMRNRDVIFVAHALAVSPLYVLDLCKRDEHAASQHMRTRRDLATAARWLRRWPETGYLPNWVTGSDGYPRLEFDHTARRATLEDYETLIALTATLDGDYRDLRPLACEAASYYAGIIEDNYEDALLEGIVQAGRAHAMAMDFPREDCPELYEH